MNTNTPSTASTPLPGLAKLFLLQTYALLPLLLLLQISLFFASNDAWRSDQLLETTAWHLASFAFCIWGLSVIVGLHARAAWAPGNARRFCLGLSVMVLALALRLIFQLADQQIKFEHFSYGDDYELYIVVMPAMLAVLCLQLHAWGRYFGTSSRLRAAFGLPEGACGPAASRPLGVALLHLFCGTFLLFYLVFFPSFLVVVRGMNDGTILMMLFMTSPQIIFPLLLLLFTWRPGTALTRLHICFAAWLLLHAIWIMLLPVLAYSELFAIDVPMFYRLNGVFGMFPLSHYGLPLLLGALWWRLTAAPEDAAWFAGRELSALARPGAAPLMLILSGYSAYYLTQYSGYYVHGLLAAPGAAEIAATAFSALLLVLAGLSIYWNLKGDPRARPAFLALSVGGIIFMVGIIFIIFDRYYDPDSLRFALNYTLPYLAEHIAIVAGGTYYVLRHQEGQPLPLTVFKIFCLSAVGLFLLPRLLQFAYALASGDGDGEAVTQAFLYLLGGISKKTYYDYGEIKLLFSPSSLAAYMILPPLFLVLLRNGRGRRLSRSAILALSGIWLLLIQTVFVIQTVLSVIYGDGPSLEKLDSKLNIVTMALLLFILYFCSSGRFARWAAGEAPAPEA